MNKFLEIFGWYGTIAIVGTYALISFSVMQSNSVFYQFLNLTGAIGIGCITLYKKVYQSAIVNIIWAIIAAVALVKLLFF